MYLVHGTSDDLVPVEQSRLFAQAATEAGLEVTLLEIEHANHTYNGVDGYSVSAAYSAGAKAIRQFIIDQK